MNIIKIRQRAFNGNLHRTYKPAKPILWIKAGVEGLNKSEMDEYIQRVLDSVEFMNSDYRVLLTPTKDHREVEMVVL